MYKYLNKCETKKGGIYRICKTVRPVQGNAEKNHKHTRQVSLVIGYRTTTASLKKERKSTVNVYITG